MWGKFPKWLKYTLLFVGTTILTYILHFPFGLLENAIYQYITDYVIETYKMPLTTFIVYCISFIAAGLIIFGAYKIGSLERKNRQNVTLKEGATKLDNKHLASTLTMMHQRMMELQKVRLSRNINLKQFESVLPTLMDKLGLVELDKWDNFENSIRKRIKRAIGKKQTGTRSAYFKAICEASRIKKELSQSQDWTIQDGLKISEWLDGYHWGIGELRDNDPRWRASWDSINPYLVNSKLRELIEKHINFSYVYSSASLIAGYSRKHRASIRLSVLYEALVGSPISPVKIDLALSEILAEIEEQMGMLGQGEKELLILSPNSSIRSPVVNKLQFVIQKIIEAKQIISEGNEIIVYLSDDFLNIVNIEELNNMLLKLQNDEKVLTIKYFPEDLLPTRPFTFTEEMLDEMILSTIEPARQQFRIVVNDKFDGFAQKLRVS